MVTAASVLRSGGGARHFAIRKNAFMCTQALAMECEAGICRHGAVYAEGHDATGADSL